MGHARGAAAVRLAKMEAEPEVAIAQVRVPSHWPTRLVGVRYESHL